MPSAVGIVADQFSRRRAQAIGLFTSVFPIGGIIGPNLGGYVLHTFALTFLIASIALLLVGVETKGLVLEQIAARTKPA